MPLLFEYDCCDFSIASDLFLPGFLHATKSPEVRIAVCKLPYCLENASTIGFRVQCNSSEFLINIDEVARYLVRNGSEILIEPYSRTEMSSVVAFLLSTVIGILLLQRDFLVLNGGVFSLNNLGNAFVGHPMTGKSSLMLSFFRNHKTVHYSDDLCALKEDSSGKISAWQISTCLSLWESTLIKVGLSTEALDPVRMNVQKYFLAITSRKIDPVSIHRITELNTSTDDLSMETPDEKDSLALLLRNTFQIRFLSGMKIREKLFYKSLKLVQQSEFNIIKRNFNLVSEKELFNFLEKRTLYENR
ncbi:MAG: hypothetical protein HQM10_26855 [Candidatus Riflebacteria bacterium]|nr:hypothetical protein [Candidatus Riflebacteria bacterium]